MNKKLIIEFYDFLFSLRAGEKARGKAHIIQQFEKHIEAMKKNILVLLVLVCGLGAAWSQEVKEVSILTNVVEGDTTFKIHERITVGGEEKSTVTYPERWLTAVELRQYIYEIAKQSEVQVLELERLKAAANEVKSFFVVALDTIAGKNTYVNTRKDELKNVLQGNWTMVVKNANGSMEKHAITITDTVVSSGDREGTITITDTDMVTLTLPVVAPTGVALKWMWNTGVLSGGKGRLFRFVR